jgi:hypothetical protein
MTWPDDVSVDVQAIRGGGPLYGIVTSWTFKLHRAPPKVCHSQMQACTRIFSKLKAAQGSFVIVSLCISVSTTVASTVYAPVVPTKKVLVLSRFACRFCRYLPEHPSHTMFPGCFPSDNTSA